MLKACARLLEPRQGQVPGPVGL
ncbi:hypothetical protein [Pseudomonas oryzihabitans]